MSYRAAPVSYRAAPKGSGLISLAEPRPKEAVPVNLSPQTPPFAHPAHRRHTESLQTHSPASTTTVYFHAASSASDRVDLTQGCSSSDSHRISGHSLFSRAGHPLRPQCEHDWFAHGRLTVSTGDQCSALGCRLVLPPGGFDPDCRVAAHESSLSQNPIWIGFHQTAPRQTMCSIDRP